MKRREFVGLAAGVAGLALQPAGSSLRADQEKGKSAGGIIGMYVHKAWPYNRPYAARVWTVDDWRGYAEGLKKLGYNTLIVWPMIEIMPSPLTPSDMAEQEKMATVIDILHGMGFRTYTTLCPNLVANNEEAAKYPYARRYYFHSLKYVDPGDYEAVREMVKRREELLRPMAKMDGCVIIDSDTGSYPGATNDQFVNIMVEHRKMLDRLRPGIELLYWMHVGWQAYGRYHATGRLSWGTREETKDMLTKLQRTNPEPWGISVHSTSHLPSDDINVAKELGVASRAVSFNYGAIEGEPTFPMTNFGADTAFRAGRAAGPRGVVGNAQTHCLQIPNTFAFVRGAANQPVAEADYVSLAEELIPGQGRLIVNAWKTVVGPDSGAMRNVANHVEAAATSELSMGPLKGLLFGDPARFLRDLVMQLRFRAAYLDFVNASQVRIDGDKFRKFIAAAEIWQGTHGYQTMWRMPELDSILLKLSAPVFDRLIAETDAGNVTTQVPGATPFERVQNFDKAMDTHTPRFLTAMKEASRTL